VPSAQNVALAPARRMQVCSASLGEDWALRKLRPNCLRHRNATTLPMVIKQDLVQFRAIVASKEVILGFRLFSLER
jgi:hypothetical protein